MINEVSRKKIDELISLISHYNKILIVGSCGAGKSTLGKSISEFLNLPIIHLDTMYYLPDWNPRSLPEFQAIQKELIGTLDAWIMDGNYQSTLEIRLQAAQIVILVDPPPILCVMRIIKRKLTYYGRAQPYNTPGCAEKFDKRTIQLLLYTIRYRKVMLPKLNSLLTHYPDIKRIRVV